jgi:hypothetical protein
MISLLLLVRVHQSERTSCPELLNDLIGTALRIEARAAVIGGVRVTSRRRRPLALARAALCGISSRATMGK